MAFSVQSLITGSTPDLVTSVGGVLIILGVVILAIQDSLVRYMELVMKWMEEAKIDNNVQVILKQEWSKSRRNLNVQFYDMY